MSFIVASSSPHSGSCLLLMAVDNEGTDLYSVLQVTHTATLTEIRRSYQRLAKEVSSKREAKSCRSR